MDFVAVILICLESTPMQECTQATSVALIVSTESQSSQMGCMRHGMLYAAASHLVTPGSYPKIFCQDSNRHMPLVQK